jgi:prenyltransferase beta subunit
MKQTAAATAIVRIAAALLIVAISSARMFAQEQAGKATLTDKDATDSAAGAALMGPAKPAIDKGLAYLASQQTNDGALGETANGRNAAICALSGMAWLASGSTPGRGPYGEQLTRVSDYIVEHVEESGFINVRDASSHGPMYEHGFATLFLAELYGMSPRNDLRDKLARAVDLIVRTQNDEGGWRYQPRKADADLSVTICQVMALRAARNAGFRVPNETIDRCVDYVKRSQNADGGFRYVLNQAESAFPRSAAGVVALYSAGIYEGPVVERGLTYLDRFLPRGPAAAQDAYFFYGHYYAVQAMWQAGGARWQQWYPAIRDLLLARQQADGSWLDPTGPQYGTAMATIILQLPDNSLPIFQR